MISNTVNIATRDGRMETYYAHPQEAGTYPAVIIYMDAPGIRDELRGFARKIAAQGYLCLLPDLYYRLGTLRFRLSHRDAPMGHVIHAAKHSLSNASVMSDTTAMLSWLAGHSRAESQAGASKWGCIGYCMAGAYVMTAAATFGDSMAAGASLYGVDLVTKAVDSPHLSADKVRGELYFGFAQHDHDVPAEVVSTLSRSLRRHKTNHRLEVFPDTHHGFCFPERNVYNEAAAERVWGRVFGMFNEQLRV